MLKTKFENFPKGKNFSTILGDFLGRGIFNVYGDLWRFRRKMGSLELGRSSIKSYAFEVINKEIQNRLLPLLACVANNKDEILDLQDDFRRFSFDSISSQLSAKRVMHVSPIVWKIKRFFNKGSERKQRRKLGFSNHKDLLSRFMQGDTLNETYLIDIVISFLLAGRDTAEKIREEANEIVGPNQELTSCEQLKDFHYLQASSYESMRLYPLIQFVSKFCLEDDFLHDGNFVKKGTRCFSQENPFKYPAFQGGVRVCLGKEMALVELESVALSFLRRFNIELVHPSHHNPRFSPVRFASFRGDLPEVCYKN
ncbi:unnamed protein product [Withania somnifera]